MEKPVGSAPTGLFVAGRNRPSRPRLAGSAGANRLLVILALIPATAMGFTLFDRHGGTRSVRPR